MSVGSNELPKGEPEEGPEVDWTGNGRPLEQTIDRVGQIAPLTAEELDVLSGFTVEDEAHYEPLDMFRQTQTRLYTLMGESLASGGADGETDQSTMGNLVDDMTVSLGTIIVDLYSDSATDEQVMDAVCGILIDDAELRYAILCDMTDDDSRVKLIKDKKVLKSVARWMADTTRGPAEETAMQIQLGFEDLLMADVRMVVQIIEEAQMRYDIAETRRLMWVIMEKLNKLTGDDYGEDVGQLRE